MSENEKLGILKPMDRPNLSEHLPYEDDWKEPVDRTRYSLDDFYTTASDRKGHSQNVQSHFPPNFVGALTKMVQSGRYPAYQTIQDVVRDGAVHRVMWLAEQESDPTFARLLKADVAYFMLENSMRKQAEYRERTVWMLEQVDLMVAKQKDKEYAVEVLRDWYAMASDMPTPYRNQLVNRITTAIEDEYGGSVVE